jgi:hypothetical protein
MLTADLIRLYPRLFHMAADGSWPSIERHGLLSTNALLDRWEVDRETRGELTAGVRNSISTIEHLEFGTAVVRDQKPIHVESLASVLDEMTVAQWLAELNSRVFFFVQPERMLGLLTARSYRGRPHTILTIDTERFVAGYELQIELCTINSGFAQPHSKAPRGRATFQSISAYRHIDRYEARTNSPWDISELCVRGGIANIRDYMTRVDRMQDGQILEQVA